MNVWQKIKNRLNLGGDNDNSELFEDVSVESVSYNRTAVFYSISEKMELLRKMMALQETFANVYGPVGQQRQFLAPVMALAPGIVASLAEDIKKYHPELNQQA